MKLKSKLMILVLTLALLCGAIALIASAETTGTVVSTPEEFANAWTNGGTFTLANDITYTGGTLTLPSGKTLTLDLGGHTLTSPGSETAASVFLNSASANLTVKNGTISVSNKAKAFNINGGTVNFENLTVTNTASDTEFPGNLVELNRATATMNGVYLSAKAGKTLTIASGTTLTAVNTTVRNTIIPNGGTDRCAIQVYGDNTITMTDSLVEAVYTGIWFQRGTSSEKNTFLFKNSTLNVNFRKDLTGDILDFNKYNGGYMHKICYSNAATMTLDGSKVIGHGSGRIAAHTASNSEATVVSADSHIVYKNSVLHGTMWARGVFATLEGTNFFMWTAQATHNAPWFVNATPGSRSYFAGNVNLDGNGGSALTGTHGGVEYSRPRVVNLNPSFRFTSNYNNQAINDPEIKCVLLHKDDTLAASDVLADLDKMETHTELSAKTYDASGKLTGLAFGNVLPTFTMANGGTLRLTRDLTIPSPEARLITFQNKTYFDLNGHWLSLGGAPAKSKPELFYVQAGDVFFYTSQPGGGIRFLAIGEGGDSDKSWVDASNNTKKGTNSLFGLNSPAAHLHLGYTDNAGETDYRGNGFTIISSVMAQYYNGGKVTIKGGNYYRLFSDNNAFFDIRTLSGNNANLLTAEDAYFYGSAYMIGGHLTTAGATCDGVTASFKNCKIDAPVIAAAGTTQFANSTVTLTNCDILRNQAAVAGVTFAVGEGCRYPSTVSIPQVATGVKGDVMINDAVMTYRGARRITLAQATAGTSSFTGEATITLNRKVTANYATLTYVEGTDIDKQLWAKGETPPQIEDVELGAGFYKTYGTIGTVTEDATYTARVIANESKVKGNLTLYANITFNIYVKADGVTGIRYNGKDTMFEDTDRVQVDGEDYFLFRINDIAPKDLSKAFRLDVIVNGSTAHYTVMTSLVKYADSVLKNASESEEGKTLVKALLDYVRETSVALGDVATDFAGIKAIDACLAKYGYTRTEWTEPESVITPATGDVKGAALELVSTPGFVFFLNDTYDGKDSVTATVNGVTKNYTITHAEGKHFFTVDNIHISNYRKDLTVKLGEQSFTYNFDVYMAGFETVPAYAHALYTYSLAAEAYLATQSNH